MSIGWYRGYGSRARRFGLGACAVGVALAVAPAAASAELTVSMSGPHGPVPKGDTATYTATVTNTNDPSSLFPEEHGVLLELSQLRVIGDRPVQNPYGKSSTTRGTCTPMDYPSKFGPYHALDCALGTLAPGATAKVTAGVQINESMRHSAYSVSNGAEDTVVTYVSAPPEISGSKKLKIKGLPDGCASQPFKLKVRAKGAKKLTGRIDGPRSADGKPVAFGIGGSDKLKGGKGGKLKHRVATDELEPDLYYEIALKAKYKHGPKQKATALFQVCA